MIRVGLAGKPEKAKSIVKGIPMLREMGLQAMEIQYTRGIQTKLEAASVIGELAKENDIKLSAHAPYYINLNSKTRKTLENSKRWILRTAEMMDALSARVMVFHAGFYHGMGSSKVAKRIARSLQSVRKKIEARGWDVILGLEITGKKTAFGTLEELTDVCGMVEGVVPVLDFAHAHARAGGLFYGKKDYERFLQRYEELGYDFLHCHFSCIKYTEKGEQRHLNLRARDPDFRPLAEILRTKKYDITIICETPVPGRDDDAMLMTQMLGL